MFEHNKDGWYPIHEASFRGYLNAVKRFVDRSNDKYTQLELVTRDDQQATPIMLGALGSNYDVVKFLYESGADLHATNSQGHGVLEIVVLRQDFKLLNYLIKLHTNNEIDLKIWTKLIKLLIDDTEDVSASAARCLENLTSINCFRTDEYTIDMWSNNCSCLIQNDIFKTLSKILTRFSKEICVSGYIILLNLVDYSLFIKDIEILKLFMKHNGLNVLINTLNNIETEDNDVICLVGKCLSRLSETKELYSICFGQESHKELVQRLLKCLIKVLEKLNNSMIVYSFLDFISNIIQFDDNLHIEQDYLKQLTSAIIRFYKSLDANDLLIGSLLRLTCLLLSYSSEIQVLLIDGSLASSLYQTLKHESETIKILSIQCIPRLCKSNVYVQKVLYNEKIDDLLINHLSKYQTSFLKTILMSALWSIAGDDEEQRRQVANKINMNILNECISDKDDNLYLNACDILTVQFEQPANKSNCAHENFLKYGDTFKLVDILTNRNTNNVLAAVRCIKRFCFTSGENSYTSAQNALQKSNVISHLMDLISYGKEDIIRAESALTLAYVCLSNKENLKIFLNSSHFSYFDLFDLFKIQSNNLKLLVAKALAIFSFNNSKQECFIGTHALLNFNLFDSFLRSSSTNHLDKCETAYQIILLSHLIYNKESSKLIAWGIQILLAYLENKNSDCNLKCFVAEKFASLSRLKNGMAEALLEINIIDLLCDLLSNSNSEILKALVSIALSNLSYNFKGRRKLLNRCRQNFSIIKTLEFYNNYSSSKHKLPEAFSYECKDFYEFN